MYPKTCANDYEFKLTILSINTQVQITLILEYGPAVELQRVKTQKMTLCKDRTKDVPDNCPIKITCLFSPYEHLISVLQVPSCIFQNLWVLEIPRESVGSRDMTIDSFQKLLRFSLQCHCMSERF